MTEVVKIHVPVSNVLGPCDNVVVLGSRFVVRLTPTNSTKYHLYDHRLFAGIGNCPGRPEEIGRDGNDCRSMASDVDPAEKRVDAPAYRWRTTRRRPKAR